MIACLVDRLLQLRGVPQRAKPGCAVNAQTFTGLVARSNYASTLRNPTMAASPTLLKTLLRTKFIGDRYQLNVSTAS